MGAAQDILRRRALEYHARPERGATCGNMALDMDLILKGLVGFGKDGRLHLTAEGEAFRAQGTEAGTAETEGLGPQDDSPVGEADAPTPSPNNPKGAGAA